MDDDEYYDDDPTPAQEEPDFEDKPTEADRRGADYAMHASEAQQLMRQWSALGHNAAAESQSLAEAQVHATLAVAAATMHAAARAERRMEAAHRWPTQWKVTHDGVNLGIHWTFESARDAGESWWKSKYPTPDGALTMWKVIGLDQFDLIVGDDRSGRTGISMKRLDDEPPF